MSLTEIRTAIVDGINAALPSLNGRCEAHGGRFDLKELQRVAVKAPAVLVACLGVSEIASDICGEVQVTASWGAFVITSDRRGSARDAGALATVSALSLLIPRNLWGRTDTQDPQRIRAANLFDSRLDAQGVALWMVDWQQALTLQVTDASGLDDFLRLHADYDINQDGASDAADDINLPQ